MIKVRVGFFFRAGMNSRAGVKFNSSIKTPYRLVQSSTNTAANDH